MILDNSYYGVLERKGLKSVMILVDTILPTKSKPDMFKVGAGSVEEPGNKSGGNYTGSGIPPVLLLSAAMKSSR